MAETIIDNRPRLYTVIFNTRTFGGKLRPAGEEEKQKFGADYVLEDGVEFVSLASPNGAVVVISMMIGTMYLSGQAYLLALMHKNSLHFDPYYQATSGVRTVT